MTPHLRRFRRLAPLALGLFWIAAALAAGDPPTPDQIVQGLAAAERAAIEKNWPAVKAAAAPDR